MNWEQAKEAMQKGLKITHQYFSSNEWMTMEGNKIVFEDVVRCSISKFFKWRSSGFYDGYELYK